MTLRKFIEFLNPEKVLEGKITFKVIWRGDKTNEWGDKWYFYHDKDETPDEDTIEKFCNNPGIVKCMDMEIDDLTMECHPNWGGEGNVHYYIEVYNPQNVEVEEESSL